MQEIVIRLLAASLAIVAWPAGAIALGEARVASALGEPLDVRIPVTTAPGEAIEGACFLLAREPGADVPRLGGARLALERSAQGATLRVRSTLPIDEPAFAFGIRVACPGQAGESRRDYSVLLDPRPAAAQPAPATQPNAPTQPTAAPAGLAAAVATLIARIGDTLESIAHAIFPRNRAAKTAYIAALRDSNPPLASLGERDPIPVDTPIALPDLRTFARAHPLGETRVAAGPRRRAAPSVPAVTEAPRVAQAAPLTARRREPAQAALAAAPKSATRSGPAFVLRLSGSEVDLSPSKGIDDRKRSQLRERLLLLDTDDQVAAVLALRNSVKQLETRVAELQLKLAGMPASLAAPKEDAAKAATAKMEAAKAEAARLEAAKAEIARADAARAEAARAEIARAEAARAESIQAEAAKAELAKADAAKADAARAEAAKAEAAKAETAKADAAKAEAARSEAAKAESVAAEAPKPAPAAAPARTLPVQQSTAWLSDILWLAGGFLIVIAVLLAWRLARRRRAGAEEDIDEDELPAAEEEAPIVVAEERREPAFSTAQPAPVARGSVASDSLLPTRISFGDSEALRRRYIEERFPEVASGAIRLEEPDSVIKAARLFYEDGAIARAVELLHFAIEFKPEEMRPWLALFEIFRLERLSGEYAELARRFKERYGESDYWRKVQYFGREIDPGNMLYQEESFKSLETIGPSAARRMAATNFDPLAENWLNAPMDFENDVLANDLRKALMTDAAMREQDLMPNPMPALRNVEIFSVA